MLEQLPLDNLDTSPAEIWGEFFGTHQPAPPVVGQMILTLFDAKRYEHVIAAIESALIEGQSQPWMYDVLALSMQIAGRPQADIERVLLSRVDFTATDVRSMIYSAAYLTRFGADKQALHLYRQASRIAPTRPEPYVLGLRLARKSGDYESIRWAGAGILTSAWTKDRERLHREARMALLEAERSLLEHGRREEADQMRVALAEALKRDLVVRLTWSGSGDLDLFIDEPPGTTCSYENPQSAGGGVLVHDGFGPKQDNCYEEYVCALATPGTFRIRVRHVWGEIVGKRATLTIVRYQGSSEEFVQTIPLQLSRTDRVVHVALPHGRRTNLQPIEPKDANRLDPQLIEHAGRISRVEKRTAEVASDFVASRRRRQQGNIRAGAISAVGYQPIVQLFSEGTSMNASAVVSADRRYVHIGAAPSFTALTDVFTFSFINNGNPSGNPGLGNGN